MWIILILVVIGIAFAAWRYLAGSEPPAGELVILVCSTECAERGQCGTLEGENKAPVVLGGANGPVVEPEQHDVFFLAGTSAEIKENMEVTLVEEGGREFQHTFSRIEFVNPLGDIAETGWVADWCIERP
jgi:hypothetical protein